MGRCIGGKERWKYIILYIGSEIYKFFTSRNNNVSGPRILPPSLGGDIHYFGFRMQFFSRLLKMKNRSQPQSPAV